MAIGGDVEGADQGSDDDVGVRFVVVAPELTIPIAEEQVATVFRPRRMQRCNVFHNGIEQAHGFRLSVVEREALAGQRAGDCGNDKEQGVAPHRGEGVGVELDGDELEALWWRDRRAAVDAEQLGLRDDVLRVGGEPR